MLFNGPDLYVYAVTALDANDATVLEAGFLTSHPYSDSRAIAISNENFRTGSLRVESYTRPGSKLFTATGICW
jgi:hypothetical protein